MVRVVVLSVGLGGDLDVCLIRVWVVIWVVIWLVVCIGLGNRIGGSWEVVWIVDLSRFGGSLACYSEAAWVSDWGCSLGGGLRVMWTCSVETNDFSAIGLKPIQPPKITSLGYGRSYVQ